MRFEKPVWTYRPPATVWTGASAEQARPAAEAGVQRPRREELSRRMALLSETALWLAGQMLDRYAGVVIRLPAPDPELAAALGRLFGSEEPVEAVSAAMYGRLLDALLGSIRVQAALEEAGLPYQASPLQQMDLIRAVSAVEDALAASNSLPAQHLLALPQLKADAWMFAEMSGQAGRIRLEEAVDAGQEAPEEEVLLPQEAPLGSLVDLSRLEVSFEREPEPLEDGYRGFDADTSVVEEPVEGAFQPEPEEEPEFRMEPDDGPDLDEDEYLAWLDRLDDVADQYLLHWDLIRGSGSLLDELPQEVLDGKEFAGGSAPGFLDSAAMGMDRAYSGVRRLITEFISWPSSRIIAILATLETAWRLLSKDVAAIARGAFGTFVLARLIQETSRLNFFLSRLLWRLSSPVEAALNSAARLTNLPYEALVELDSVLSVARNSRVAGRMASRIPADRMAELKEKVQRLPKALVRFSQAVSNGRAALVGRVSRAQASLFQLIDRRLVKGASQADALDALRTIQELKSIFESILRRRQFSAYVSESAAAVAVPEPPQEVAAVLRPASQGRWEMGESDADFATDNQRTDQTLAV